MESGERTQRSVTGPRMFDRISLQPGGSEAVKLARELAEAIAGMVPPPSTPAQKFVKTHIELVALLQRALTLVEELGGQQDPN